MKRFNFNNEQDTTPITVDEVTKAVTFNGVEFASVQEFAEFYALARDVKPENLKNWVLVENGDTYSFVLRAATAGHDASEIAIALRAAGFTPDEIAQALAGNHVADEPQDEFTSVLERYDVEFLKYGAGVETLEQLRELADELVEDAYYDEDEDEWYNDDYHDVFVSFESQARLKLATEFPEIPADFAFAYKQGTLADKYESNPEAANKIWTVAHLAGRDDVQVHFVNENGAERRRVSNLQAYTHVYVVGNKVIVVL